MKTSIKHDQRISRSALSVPGRRQALPKALIALEGERYRALFSHEDRARLERLVEPVDSTASPFTGWLEAQSHWKEVEVLITGWGTPPIPEAFFSCATALRLVAHAGATRNLFTGWRGAPGEARIALASSALGRSVAEFAFSLMNLATKRAFWLERRVREGGWREPTECFGGCFELFRARVGLIGGGETARQLMRMLQPLECEVIVYDPYVSPSVIAAEGGRRVETLEALFAESDVVSLHAVHNSQTEGMIRGEHFKLLRDGAVFINTARGAIVRERELIEELSKERFVACLDVSCTEPPAADHPFRTLPNVVLTPHIAGAIAENRFRMGHAVVNEVEAYAKLQSRGVTAELESADLPRGFI